MGIAHKVLVTSLACSAATDYAKSQSIYKQFTSRFAVLSSCPKYLKSFRILSGEPLQRRKSTSLFFSSIPRLYLIFIFLPIFVALGLVLLFPLWCYVSTRRLTEFKSRYRMRIITHCIAFSALSLSVFGTCFCLMTIMHDTSGLVTRQACMYTSHT